MRVHDKIRASKDNFACTRQHRRLTHSLSLKDGELGPLQPAPWGAFAAYLEKRAPLTDAQWKQYQGTLSKTLLGNERELLFLEWLNTSRAAAQIKMMGGNGRGDRGGA